MDFQLDDALPVLRRTPGALRALLLDLPDPWIGANEGPGTWSPFDVVGHLIHGDRTQSQRNGALSGFQEGRYQILVATDIASRGLHVDDVAHVINYDVPKTAEDFIHRVGRTGRAGTQGRATTLAAGGGVMELRQIERALKLRIERIQLNTSGPEQPKRLVQNTLATRTLTALPGEIFV